MGYRSDVALAISKDLMPRFLTVFAKCPEAQALVFKDHETMDQDYDGEKTFFVYWSGIKWYTSYPEIQAIEEFLAECEADDFEELENSYDHYRFVRLGEENDDIEEMGELCACDINFRRELVF